jgi:hypothetical protein
MSLVPLPAPVADLGSFRTSMGNGWMPLESLSSGNPAMLASARTDGDGRKMQE